MSPIVLCGLIAALALFTPVASALDGSVAAGCKQDALDLHKYLRTMHQAPPLVWNDTLATASQTLATSLAGQGCPTTPFAYNQNGASLRSDASYSSPCSSAILEWYSAAANWSFSDKPVTDNPQLRGGTLYTFPYIVWSNTTDVGCGAAQGDSGCWSVVCRYSPPATKPSDAAEVNAAFVDNVKPAVVPANLTANDSCSEDILQVYNKYRGNHLAPSMSWSDVLAIGAQSWANKLAVEGCQAKTSVYGAPHKIIAWPGGHPSTTLCNSYAETQYWPVAQYKFTDTPWTDNEDQYDDVYSFVAMVYQNNTKIGCGRAQGANGCWVAVCWFHYVAFNNDAMLDNVLPPTPAPTTQPSECEVSALQSINAYRRNHSAQPLSWNATFAAGFQALARSVANNKCNVTWWPLDVGMDSAVLRTSNATGVKLDTANATGVCGSAVDLWYSLNNNTYSFTTRPWTDNAATKDKWRHFTQIIWQSTTQVGCGSAQGPDGCWVVYCKYDPPGNVETNNAFLQNVLPVGASSPFTTGESPAPTDSKSKHTTVIVVATSVGAALVIAMIAGAVFWWRRHRQQRHGSDSTRAVEQIGKVVLAVSPTNATDTNVSTGLTASAGQLDSSNMQQQASNISSPTSPGAYIMEIPGLATGEPFTRGTAFEYSWNKSYSFVPGITQAIESTVNDMQLDAMVQHSNNDKTHDCPVVCLSKDEVKQQLQLLTNGLRGRGGAALVFQALWPSRFGPDALLAVKVLKDGYDCNPYILQSFSYEASVLASLRHSNVVKLYGYCLDPPNVCLIMELLPCSLKDVLYGRSHGLAKTSAPGASSASVKAASLVDQETLQGVGREGGAPLTMAQVLHISTEIAAGLAYLHEQPEQLLTNKDNGGLPRLNEVSAAADGNEHATDIEAAVGAGNAQKIVHRDLKPANILVNSHGQIKISDFGLARRHDSMTIETRHMGAGTVPYQAPEILSGARAGVFGIKATNRCDVYSMAMIFWELLSRQPPWKELNEVVILSQVINGKRPELPTQDMTSATDEPLVNLSQLPASLNALPAFNDIIRQCWAQRDWRRPTAVDVHRLLVELQQKYQTAASASVHVHGPGEVSK